MKYISAFLLTFLITSQVLLIRAEDTQEATSTQTPSSDSEEDNTRRTAMKAIFDKYDNGTGIFSKADYANLLYEIITSNYGDEKELPQQFKQIFKMLVLKWVDSAKKDEYTYNDILEDMESRGFDKFITNEFRSVLGSDNDEEDPEDEEAEPKKVEL